MPFRWTINPTGDAPRLHLLLRPPHPHLPRSRRRARLREGDRGQGQRARGAARRAGAAVLEARTRRAGDEHGPLSVGRGPLPADAGDLAGAGRFGHPRRRCCRSRRCCCAIRGDEAGAEISANLSIPTFEEKEWRSPSRTPRTRARHGGGGRVEPPGHPDGDPDRAADAGVNDSPGQVERILELAEEAGAVSVGGIALHLRGEVRGIFFDWLRSQRPDLVPRYERLYARGAYAPGPSGSGSRS